MISPKILSNLFQKVRPSVALEDQGITRGMVGLSPDDGQILD